MNPRVKAYLTIPREVLAIQYTGAESSADDIRIWLRSAGRRAEKHPSKNIIAGPLRIDGGYEGVLVIETRYGMAPVPVGDYVLRESRNSFTIMSQTLFEQLHTKKEEVPA